MSTVSSDKARDDWLMLIGRSLKKAIGRASAHSTLNAIDWALALLANDGTICTMP